jgi:hypothetical protein
MYHGPLARGHPFIKGILTGSLIVGAFSPQYGIFAQIVLLLFAAIIFLDTCFIYGRETHLLTFLANIVIGIIIGVIFTLAGLMDLYLVVVLVSMAIVYLHIFMSHKERRK